MSKRLFFNTIKHLKLKQIIFQIIYKCKLNKVLIFPLLILETDRINKNLLWKSYFKNIDSYVKLNTFNFLNIKHKFNKKIDWNFDKYKKLWNYNLNYFDFLNQNNISNERSLAILSDFSDSYKSINHGHEPYPTSLRIINLIKYVCEKQYFEKKIIEIIKSDTLRLSKNIEYHILGNHLLENGFALWFSGVLFQNKSLTKFSKNLIIQQLDEQILEDGGHFELSPTYHMIITLRILDCINFIRTNSLEENIFEKFLVHKSAKMKSWLENMTFGDGSVPLINDSSFEFSQQLKSISNYFNKLKLTSSKINLKQSGYRMFKNNNYEMLIDISNIKSAYQAGHSHADTFNFILHIDKTPHIIDTGTSTYNICERRTYERSTEAHNTVVIKNESSSEIWSSFRLGNRASVNVLVDNYDFIEAEHDGYKKYNTTHKRSWKLCENEIIIHDCLHGKIKSGVAYLHFHESLNLKINKNNILSCRKMNIIFENAKKLFLKKNIISKCFNRTIESKVLIVEFETYLNTIIRIKTN